MIDNPVLLGIDLGTSSAKAALIDPAGKLLAVAAEEYPVDTPFPGWAEQHPDTWYRAVAQTVRQALVQAQTPPEAVAAVGLSGQMHGMAPFDRSGRPLYPAIIWADQRSREQVERLQKEIGVERLGRWTGNPLATGFMLASWTWLCENRPEIARQVRLLLLPKDALRLRLTGETGSEPSDASSTLLFDPAQRRWSAELLEALQIDPRLLPAIGESAAIAGGLLPLPAGDLGLRPGTPVVFGGSDQACQAIGHGVIDPGVVSCTIGTGGQLFAPLLQPRYDPQLRLHLFCHALPARWHLEAATLSAGLSLRWLRDAVLDGFDYGSLADLAAQAPAGAEGLFFLPYLVGERTPHMDPQARGAFIGLTLRHRKPHLVRALMEGVVFALRQGLDLMESLGNGDPQGAPGRIIASGGATRHPLWLQLQADIFNRPIAQAETVEAAAIGAALLAGVGAGIYPDVAAACRQAVPSPSRVIFPDPRRAALYAEIYPRFCELYPRLSEK